MATSRLPSQQQLPKSKRAARQPKAEPARPKLQSPALPVAAPSIDSTESSSLCCRMQSTPSPVARNPVALKQLAPSPASAERNPVGRVQELAQKQLLPPPIYTFESSGTNNPATRLFTCTGRLRDWACRGAGPSKRLAKQRAAAELLHQLLTAPLVAKAPLLALPAPPPAPPKDAPTPPLDEAEFQRLRTSKWLLSAARAGAEVGGLFRGVRNRKAGAPLPPVEVAAAPAPSEQLLELGRALRFGVQFLPQPGGTGQPHRSVVKLSTMPTIVVVGGGASAEESREQACRAALEYLSVLAKENVPDARK